jgi:hypothetical protein
MDDRNEQSFAIKFGFKVDLSVTNTSIGAKGLWE